VGNRVNRTWREKFCYFISGVESKNAWNSIHTFLTYDEDGGKKAGCRIAVEVTATGSHEMGMKRIS
jgi:hypothetical protein